MIRTNDTLLSEYNRLTRWKMSTKKVRKTYTA